MRILIDCWWNYKLVQLLWRTVWRFLKKTKNSATIWSSNSTPGHISRENPNLKRNWHPIVHRNIIYSSQDMETIHRYLDKKISRWMDKEDMVPIYNRILFSHKKEWNNAICSKWMDLEIIILSEVSWIEKDNYHMISLICRI